MDFGVGGGGGDVGEEGFLSVVEDKLAASLELLAELFVEVVGEVLFEGEDGGLAEGWVDDVLVVDAVDLVEEKLHDGFER